MGEPSTSTPPSGGRNAGGFALAGMVFAILAGFIWAARGKRATPKTTTKGAPLGPYRKGGAKMSPKAGSDRNRERIRALADLLDKVWPDVTGQPGPMPDAAKEMALAQAAAEWTGYGQGWDGDMRGSWNVGSYQCGGTQTDTSYYRCVKHEDSSPQPDGSQKKYTTTFRYYIDGTTPDGKSRGAAEAGAWDFLRSITVKPFPALDELLSGDVLAYAKRQAEHGYYEGFNLSRAGEEAWASTLDALEAMGLTPRRPNVTPRQFAGRIALYASSMARALPEIAAALDHPEVMASAPEDITTFRPAFVRS